METTTAQTVAALTAHVAEYYAPEFTIVSFGLHHLVTGNVTRVAALLSDGRVLVPSTRKVGTFGITRNGSFSSF